MSTTPQYPSGQDLVTRRKHMALKRVFDTALIVASAPLTIPATVLAALLVRINMGKPIFFRQQRVGLGEETFELLKFRSMLPETDLQGNQLSEVERLTAFGRLLRRSSMDELPQLLNVLRGEMSLVGPRPLKVEYVPSYTQSERLRHSVRPGITGAAQVSGRNNLDWDMRLGLDTAYARTGSLFDDVKILWRTFASLSGSKDAFPDSFDHEEDFDEFRSYPADGSYALRRIEPRDAEAFVRWFDVQPLPEIMALDEHDNPEGIHAWLKSARLDPYRKDLVLYDLQTRQPAAIAGYRSMAGSFCPDIYIVVDPERNEHQTESVALSLLLEYVKMQGDVDSAAVELPGEREKSITLFQSHGFTVITDGSLEDGVRMETKW
ncbi:sugar transferase [Corynebacterium sp. A21]|uniref:sugar transferase n=1 Tax=Corynebacterium sp. A21 TaxID=3457318 RepID=UPI003FD4AC16